MYRDTFKADNALGKKKNREFLTLHVIDDECTECVHCAKNTSQAHLLIFPVWI